MIFIFIVISSRRVKGSKLKGPKVTTKRIKINLKNNRNFLNKIHKINRRDLQNQKLSQQHSQKCSHKNYQHHLQNNSPNNFQKGSQTHVQNKNKNRFKQE